MINRAIIRAKVVQLVYAFYQNGKNLDSAEKELLFSLSKAYDLYQYLLLLMVEITEYEQKLNPDSKLATNRFAAQLGANKQLLEYKETQNRTWKGQAGIIKKLHDQILATQTYGEYVAETEPSFQLDREFWRKTYKTMVFNNETIDEVLEEMSLYWNDDKEIVDTFVLKTIKRLEEEKGEEAELLPEYSNPADRDFALKLFHKTILNEESYRGLIQDQLSNWSIDRLALMDVVIMQTAIAEFFAFVDVPFSVTINEAVELTKIYSTRNSPGFVNGTLDNINLRLVDEGAIQKR